MLERVLVVDDEPVVLDVLTEVLQREGFLVSEARDAVAGLELLAREGCELVLCDIRMPGMDGFEMLREVRRCHPGTDVIIMTGYGSIDGAIDAMSLGAADYLIKPLNPKDVVARIRSITQRRRLEAQIHSLQSELRSRYDRHNIVAQSPRMMAVVAALNRVSGGEEPIVICGEPGSGRGFLARAVHHFSPRRGEPFHSLDCNLLPADRLGSILFGARVDASRVQRGELERLVGGTLHLANFEAFPSAEQRRLSEAFASKQYRRTDDTADVPLRTRLILTTPAPIDALLGAGRMAEGLRSLRELATLHVPPLRHRREDIPGLVALFVDDYEVEHGLRLRVLPESLDLLSSEPFPGNVRQLYATLAHCATLCQDGILGADAISRGLRQTNLSFDASPLRISEHLDDREFQIVLRAVQRHPRRLDEAARELGVSRTTLWRRMRKYDIRLPGSEKAAGS